MLTHGTAGDAVIVIGSGLVGSIVGFYRFEIEEILVRLEDGQVRRYLAADLRHLGAAAGLGRPQAHGRRAAATWSGGGVAAASRPAS